MSRCAKISTIGAANLTFNNECKFQDMINEIINYWRVKLSQVLPEKPDLIVLPELCDQPQNLSEEQLHNYYFERKNQMQIFFSAFARINSCYLVFPTARKGEDGKWKKLLYCL